MTNRPAFSAARVVGAAGLLVVASAVLAACASASMPVIGGAAAISDSANASAETTLVVDGHARSYLVRAPAALDGVALPVLVMLHGAGGNAERAETATGFTGLGARDGFIVVYPNGTRATAIDGQLAWNAGDCCGQPVIADIDDVAFLDAVLDDVEARYEVDSDRIFVAGFSNGGMLAYRMACELGDRIAAIAVVSGALNVACDSPRPTSVLIVHGAVDETVPYHGGPTNARTAARFGQWSNASVADAAAFWSAEDECDLTPSTTVAGSISWDSYSGCDGGRYLEMLTIEGGTHVWPVAAAEGLDASELIVSSFGLDE